MSAARTRRLLLGATLACLALVAAVLVAAATWDRGGREGDDGPGFADPVAATGVFAPRVALFGDTVTARLDVVLDRSLIDPDLVAVRVSFAPWQPVAPPRRRERNAGSTAHVRMTYVLRCLTGPCAPARDTERVEFPPARVTYEAPVGESTSRLSVDVRWPVLVVHSRIDGSDGEQRDALAAPWRADLVSLPAVSYRLSPALAVVLLALLGGGLLAIAAVAGYRALPRPEPEAEPELPPPPPVSPLEQALALLERPAGTNGSQDQRRALELVADEVERLGDRELAELARALAWSEHAPESEASREVAAGLRRRLESRDGVLP